MKAKVASLIAVANGTAGLFPGVALAKSAIRTAFAAAIVVMVAAALGKVATSTTDVVQAGLVTVPGVMMLAVTAAAHASAKPDTQEASPTGGSAASNGISTATFNVKIPGDPVEPACTFAINAAMTPAKAVIPTTASAVGVSARMSLDKLFTLGNIILS
jgi:hypothetical protein